MLKNELSTTDPFSESSFSRWNKWRLKPEVGCSIWRKSIGRIGLMLLPVCYPPFWNTEIRLNWRCFRWRAILFLACLRLKTSNIGTSGLLTSILEFWLLPVSFNLTNPRWLRWNFDSDNGWLAVGILKRKFLSYSDGDMALRINLYPAISPPVKCVEYNI